MNWENHNAEVKISNNKLILNAENKPHNESDEHYKKKLVLGKYFEDLGMENISFEDKDNFMGLRFDVTAEAENNRVFAAEAGDFNCRSLDIVLRLKKTYEAGVDYVLWWPHGPMHSQSHEPVMFRDAVDVFCMAEHGCGGGVNGLNFWFDTDSCLSGNVYFIDLMHLFEPRLWHEEREIEADT